MEEVILVTSAKESEGVGVFDVRTGSTVCTNFKNCGCDSAGDDIQYTPDTNLTSLKILTCYVTVICSVGGPSSFAGQGYSGDYVVVSQSKKPQINVWQWGKPQVLMPKLNLNKDLDLNISLYLYRFTCNATYKRSQRQWRPIRQALTWLEARSRGACTGGTSAPETYWHLSKDTLRP